MKTKAQAIADATIDGTFEYSKAWHDWALPAYQSQPENVRKLVEKCASASWVRQDRNLDLPWPSIALAEHCANEEQQADFETIADLQREFSEVPSEILAQAIEVVYAFGYWFPGKSEGLSNEDYWLGTVICKKGAYWRFKKYVDQSIRERNGKPWAGVDRQIERSKPSELETFLNNAGYKLKLKKDVSTVENGVAFFNYRAKIIAPNGVKIKTPYSQGSGIKETPKIDSIVHCLVLDAGCYECSETFEGFCAEFGYDEDSRKAKKTYKACKKTAERLPDLFGEDYEQIKELCSDM
jgi:hypothetical protein